MDYQKTLEYIHSRGSAAPGAPTLGKIEDLMARLGDPQKACSFVHIAGTNGKGSVAALMASALIQAGYTTGLYTSPYLEDFCERIQINGVPIGQEALGEITALVAAAEAERTALGLEPVTEFELVTAIAFVYFRRSNCHVVVLETGLGGRFDPTNLICEPMASVITHIALDHTAILGGTIAEIAYQKAGIIKPGCPTIIAPNEPEALTVLEKECAKVKAEASLCQTDQIKNLCLNMQGTRFTAPDGKQLRVGLLGRHQAANALTAYTALKKLRSRGLTISDRAIEEGFAKVCWPGRFEIISRSPLIILDSAHNPDGARALMDTYHELFGQTKPVAVIGALRHKDWRSLLEIIAPNCHRLYLTAPEDLRAVDAKELEAFAASLCPVIRCGGLENALAQAMASQDEGRPMLVCGSVILAGQARTALKTLLDDGK